jgi:hypothetical protein
MLFRVLKICKSNFHWYPTVLLNYRNWFHYFRNCELFAVIDLVISMSCSNWFIVTSILFILGWFHFWCVMHVFSFPKWPLVEFLYLQKVLENYFATLVIPRINNSSLTYLSSILGCFQMYCYWNVSTTYKCADAMFWFVWCMQEFACAWIVLCI